MRLKKMPCLNILFLNFKFDFLLNYLIFHEQVLEVVRSNYDTLTLKLQDGLDQFERYSEQPKEAAFFKELVCFQSSYFCQIYHNHISNIDKYYMNFKPTQGW